ncbi:MAG: site-2 protease family protein [Candidatus Aminicenantes bacterium]|nr:site-2 protease family protein [Candidatus Aminicenantes bacterium]
MENNLYHRPPRKRFRLFEKDRPWLNVLLFVLTFFSIFYFGINWSVSYIFSDSINQGTLDVSMSDILSNRQVLTMSFFYSVVLISILLAHEMGHYLMSRRYGIDATLPFFIPFPSIIGTLGAYIRIRSPISQKKQLFDIGIAGPLSGFVLALPALIYGVSRSKVVPFFQQEDSFIIGDPLIMKFLGLIFFKGIPSSHPIVLHPLAFAGWVGMLVTSFNLCPAGQLDGGHIAYVILGKKALNLGRILLMIFILMGFFFWFGWFVWAGLIGLLGLKHPRIMDEYNPLSKKRKVLALIVLVIFILSFIPAPIFGWSFFDFLQKIFMP